ncbi:MAG: hypothetical protein NC094_09055 [Bacteroidales bacterium]|nr:hypothetical protein [Lachnoclostridium sp.]MCM1385152.1 hypothetical protein [Lachnoclostridium sp.]MCM1465554.1 hypothetical protein [Bacteroidales bacterium]
MPRVTVNKKEYMVADLISWIIGKMHMQGIRQEDVARELGITQGALCIRFKRGRDGKFKDVFSYGDLLVLFKLLGATDEEKQRLLTL